MKIEFKPEMTFESMAEVIQENFPQYKTEIKKNPVAKFNYIQIRKTGAVGVWIRIFEKKNKVQLMNAMPSALVRGLLGGLILVAFTHKAQSKIRKEVGEKFIQHYNTKEL